MSSSKIDINICSQCGSKSQYDSRAGWSVALLALVSESQSTFQRLFHMSDASGVILKTARPSLLVNASPREVSTIYAPIAEVATASAHTSVVIIHISCYLPFRVLPSGGFASWQLGRLWLKAVTQSSGWANKQETGAAPCISS